MKQLIILILLCIHSSLMAQRTNPIQEAIANYDYEMALALIAKEKPSSALHIQRGTALKGLGRQAEALLAYQAVLTFDTTNVRAYIDAAECCKALEKDAQASDYYRRALRLNPENKYVRIQYISSLLTLKRFQDALGESNLMAETDSSAVALHLQAQSHEGLKQLLPAMGCYYLIQEKYPNDHQAAVRLGALNIAAKEYAEAIAVTEVYRRIDTTNVAVNRQNALAYCLNQDYPIATRRYQYLVSQGDSTLRTLYNLGVCYYATTRWYEAYDCLKIVLEEDPENANMLYYLGRASAKTSWKDEGVEHLQKAIDLTIPKDSVLSRLYVGLIDCYKMARRYKEQLNAMQVLYEKYDKQNHRLLYHMASLCCYYLKDKKNSERYLDAFIKTRPKEKQTETPQTSVELDDENFYNAAANWLKDLRRAKTMDEFLQYSSGQSIY